MLKRYPFDPTGQSTTNLVVGELHHLDAEFDLNMPRIIFPRLGPFYNDSLEITYNGRQLVLNEDYLLTFFWQHATYMSGLPVSVAFQITNTKIKDGDITINYQVVGGEYQDRSEALSELLENFPQNTRNVFWDEVLEKPEAFIPTRHLHHINDVFGMSRFIGIIDQLRRSLEHQSVLKLKSVYSRFLLLKSYVEDNLSDIDAARRGLVELNSAIETRLLNYVSKTELSDGLQQNYNALQGIIANASQTLDIRIDTLTGTVNRNKTDLDNAIAALNTAVTEANNGIRSTIADLNTLVTDNHNELDTNIKNEVARLTGLITAAKGELTTTINNIDREHDRSTINLSARIDGLNGNIQTITTNLNSKVDTPTLTTKVSELTNLINSAIASVRSDLNTGLNGVKGEANTGISTLEERTNNLNTKIAEVEKLLTSLSSYETIQENDRKHSEITRNINELRTTLNLSIESKANELNQLLDNNKTTINNTIDGLRNTLTTVNQTIRELDTKINADYVTDTELQAKVTELTELFNNTINNINQSTNLHQTQQNELESRVSTLESSLDNIPAQLNELRTTLLNRIQNINEFETKERVGEIRQELIDLINNANNSFTRLLEPVNNRIDGVDRQITNVGAAIVDTANKLTIVENNLNAIPVRLDNIANTLNTVSNDVETLKTLDPKITANTEKITATETSLNEFKVTTTSGLANANSTITQNKQETDNRLSELTNLISNNSNTINLLKQSNSNNYYDLSYWGSSENNADKWVPTNATYSRFPLMGSLVNVLMVSPASNTTVTIKAKKELDLNKLYRLSFFYYFDAVMNEDGIDITFGEGTKIPVNIDGTASASGWYLYTGYIFPNDGMITNVIYNVESAVIVNAFSSTDILSANVTNGDLRIASGTNSAFVYYPALYEVNGDEPSFLPKFSYFKSRIDESVKLALRQTDRRLFEAEFHITSILDRLDNNTNTNDGNSIDDAELKRLVYLKMHEIVADERLQNAANINIPDLVIHPDEADGIVFYDNVNGRSAYPISKMDSTLQTNELQRTIFTPNTVFEFDKTSTWTIPDIYDGLIAQVYVTSAARTMKLINGNTLLYPPSTKMGYVRIKGGVNVPIEVGTISSFGNYITNDGISTKGLIQPTYPVVIPFTSGLEASEDINTYQGKLGKVIVIL